ncbi:glycerophosphoryl diester phosphodiesterase [Rhodocytophaga aerolata]|uniref:Glycerophosphoryl diester phosphodiesterase n=1 Tax=Rhodocytophaga aerolata TaxID=455078 RepID=A0ABT8RBB1_9BACT|nr:glycerophosphoryl diester phosphodiesterase [Rhodocytophaga aerolata]MDO1449391.1 glycerophosphoryl diester phosphodiesterase [Rhodocytophaga aerolata]
MAVMNNGSCVILRKEECFHLLNNSPSNIEAISQSKLASFTPMGLIVLILRTEKGILLILLALLLLMHIRMTTQLFNQLKHRKQRNQNRLSKYFLAGFILVLPLFSHAQKKITLVNSSLQLEWQKTAEGYTLNKVQVQQNNKNVPLPMPTGEYTFLYSPDKPDSLPLFNQVDDHARNFPEPIYKYIVNTWHSNLKPVAMNTAGTAHHFFPSQAKQVGHSEVRFMQDSKEATVEASWALHPMYKNDILVEINLTAKQAGYFSLASPTLATISEKDLTWGIIPGHFQGKALQNDLVLSYAYGQGIPRKPIVVRERTASTLAPLISQKNGFTLALIPEPGTGRDPWEKDKNTHNDWQLGLSLMNRKAELTPTAYYPVLGEKNSYLNAGESRTFKFRYTLQLSDWYLVYKHAINDVYRFPDVLALKQTRHSLTNRVLAMLAYVNNDTTSLWRLEKFNGQQIGAQAYLGGVVGSDKDAMKNSDYGAMWMLATISGDSVLRKSRLPYARNFKLAQQQKEAGFFQGAAVGQYYLSKSQKFTEEWGPYVEPIGLTYYTMLDIGNVLLFDPNDTQLKERLSLGADRLLSWQHPDGHWEVAYDRETQKPRFTELKDVRPTFYGLLVAYRILGDKKYLDAARKGADWFVENAVHKGHFLGVCGDLRFVPDFATGQSVQALLDLFDLTGEKRYKEAALTTGRMYTASIYTHPIPTREKKLVNGIAREDWEISQAGLSFEHGGSVGSANIHGPIQLASHAGMFVRLFGLTNDSLYLNMARVGVLGRDAFVHEPTSVASYYWRAMNAGAGPYPHHAWWQIGWITDYLLSEISLRSGGQVEFPRGFVTPKVGPHQTYGFAPGKVFGNEAQLHLPANMVQVSNPLVDYMGATSTKAGKVYVLLLNNDNDMRTTTIGFNAQHLLFHKKATIQKANLLNNLGQPESDLDTNGNWTIQLPPYGLKVIEIAYQ